jgi:hypothetical protein
MMPDDADLPPDVDREKPKLAGFTADGQFANRAAKQKTRLSDMLSAIANDESRERISIGDLLASMDARAMGALLLIFALPNVLPTLPGTSGILGLPLIYLTSQMMMGRLPWLPKFIAGRSLARRDFAALIDRVEPWLTWSERFLRPRLSLLVHEKAERLIGLVALALSVILILPIPLGNMLPAFAICLFALGLMEHDGVWVIAGLVVTVAAVSVVAAVLFALAKSLLFVLHGAFI